MRPSKLDLVLTCGTPNFPMLIFAGRLELRIGFEIPDVIVCVIGAVLALNLHVNDCFGLVFPLDPCKPVISSKRTRPGMSASHHADPSGCEFPLGTADAIQALSNELHVVKIAAHLKLVATAVLTSVAIMIVVRPRVGPAAPRPGGYTFSAFGGCDRPDRFHLSASAEKLPHTLVKSFAARPRPAICVLSRFRLWKTALVFGRVCGQAKKGRRVRLRIPGSSSTAVLVLPNRCSLCPEIGNGDSVACPRNRNVRYEWSMAWERACLGATGLEVCRLGLAAGYGAPAAAVERAFEHGLNYFYWGSRRSPGFAEGLRRLAPQRNRFLLVIQSYSRAARLIGWSLERALRTLGFDYADVLLLGLWNRRPPERILDAARRLKDRGLVRWLALSTHHRPLVPSLAAEGIFDIFHVRYNAVNTGAERDVFPLLPSGDRPGIVTFTATRWGQLLGHRRIPKNEKTPTATDCYRFVLSNPAVDVCLAGPDSLREFDAALEALRRGPMSDEELAWMRRVGRAIYGKP